ncbi:MAG: hypothetical protein Q7T23_06950 [Phenylobacterium sp.]|nr:hypothetical protein [Phenylobacterium sp.]
MLRKKIGWTLTLISILGSFLPMNGVRFGLSFRLDGAVAGQIATRQEPS